MSDDRNALADWLALRFRDPMAQIEDRDHEGMILGRSEAELEGEEDDEADLPAL